MENVSTKSRTVALLLSLFFGIFGAHRFYTGNIGTGIAMCLISITLFGLLVTGVWNLIDLILILSGKFRDSDNREVRQW